MTELKPCPFCGGKAEFASFYEKNDNIICENCQISMENIGRTADDFKDDRSPAERLAEKWNRRVRNWKRSGTGGQNMRNDYSKEIKRCSNCFHGIRNIEDHDMPIICYHDLDFRQSDCDDYISREVEQ